MEVAKTDLHRYIELFYNRELSARLQAVSPLGYMSPVAIYNANGAKIYEYAYDAWGNIIKSAQVAAGGSDAHAVNPFRYRGYYYDTETGFYYLQSRYYNPEWGRFLNADVYVNAKEERMRASEIYADRRNNSIMYILTEPIYSRARSFC